MLLHHLFRFFEQFTYDHQRLYDLSSLPTSSHNNTFSKSHQLYNNNNNNEMSIDNWEYGFRQVIHPPRIFVDGYANVSYTHYLPVWVNSLSMANSICFGIYYMCMGIFFYKIKSRKIELKRIHKLLFVLAILFVAIQSVTLIVRVVFDAMHLYARIYTESTGNLLRMEFLIALNVMGALTIFFMFSDFIFLFIVLFFFQKIL